MFWYRWTPVLGLALLAFAVSGCGARTVKINGTLLKGGKPMTVSKDTYVTLSFIPAGENQNDSDRTSHNATFNHAAGTYTAEMPPGKYRTKLIIALPPVAGKPSAPPRPIDSNTVHDLASNQELNIEVPGP